MGTVVYQFPADIGDTVYTVYDGKIYPCEVTGFQIIGMGIKYPNEDLEHQMLLSHICLSQKEVKNKSTGKKEEQMYEAGTDGRTGT